MSAASQGMEYRVDVDIVRINRIIPLVLKWARVFSTQRFGNVLPSMGLFCLLRPP